MEDATRQQNNQPLDILTNALSRMRSGSRIDSKDLWLGKTAEELSQVTDNSDIEKTVVSVKDALQQLKRVGELLDSLSLSSKTLMDTLREKSKPMLLQHGIMTLPDELLAEIFECANDSLIQEGSHNEGRVYMGRMYNACHRFRQVALNTPSLWTILHTGMPREAFKTYLERSKIAELSIIIRSPFSDESLRMFLLDILPYTHRWRKVVIECASESVFEWELFDARLGKISGLRELHLPALQSLSVRVVGSRSSDSITRDDAKDFFSRWKTPKLRQLDLLSVVPSRTHNYGDTITCLTFTFGNMDVGLRYFFSFLGTLPNLDDFTLVGILPTAFLTETNDHSASLPLLTSLTLRRCDNTTLNFVLKSFDMPKVSKLVLDMDLTSYGSTKDLSFLNILYDHNDFVSRIKILELSLDRSRSEVQPHGVLDHLFTNFTHLEHFSLVSRPKRPYTLTGKVLERMMFHSLKKRPLKTMRIIDSTDLTASLPRTLHYLLGSQPDMSEFQRLEIVGRTIFIEHDFHSVPKDKVVWVEDGNST